jgi:hypothetical protein
MRNHNRGLCIPCNIRSHATAPGLQNGQICAAMNIALQRGAAIGFRKYPTFSC